MQPALRRLQQLASETQAEVAMGSGVGLQESSCRWVARVRRVTNGQWKDCETTETPETILIVGVRTDHFRLDSLGCKDDHS